jgi:hypothetical protein
LCKRKFDDVAVLEEISLEELFEIRKENKYNDVKDDNHQIVKYTGDSGGIMSLTGATERTGWIHRRDSLKVVGIGGRRYCSRVNIALLQISKIRCLLTHSIHF